MPACLVVADDLTGACDCGVQLLADQSALVVKIHQHVERGVSGRAGVPQTTVRGDYSIDSVDGDVLVVNTESRNVTAARALASLRGSVRPLFSHGKGPSPVVYKKIDSTLRGHCALEIATLMQEMNASVCILAPALPSAKRSVPSRSHPLHCVVVFWFDS